MKYGKKGGNKGKVILKPGTGGKSPSPGLSGGNPKKGKPEMPGKPGLLGCPGLFLPGKFQFGKPGKIGGKPGKFRG